MTRRSRWIAIATLLLAFAGCGPRLVPLPELAPGLRAARYRAALEEREARGVAVDAQVVLWADAPTMAKLPGAEARLLMAKPDAFRLRIGSLFGTALDLGARGDSLTAYVPSRRKVLNLDARRDAIGIRQPGGLAFRALSAAWRPPESSWEGATWSDTLLRVSWAEEGDTLAIGVGTDGLPAWAELTRPEGGAVQVFYRRWDRGSGVAWPALIDFVDVRGGLKLTCKVARVRFAPQSDPSRLAVMVPPGAQRWTLEGLRHALERLGAP